MADERQIEYMALSELMTRLHPDNPKNHDLGAIIESYKNHGYVASGILDDRTGLFLAGHGRVLALANMKRQKMDTPDGIRNGGDDWFVPVQVGYSSKNDVQAKAYIVADNSLTTLGGWDEPKLAELLQELANSNEIALESSGYSGDDLDLLLNDLAQKTLDDLQDEYGEPQDRDFWPFVRVQVSPETHTKFEQLMADQPGADDAEKFDAIISGYVVP